MPEATGSKLARGTARHRSLARAERIGQTQELFSLGATMARTNPDRTSARDDGDELAPPLGAEPLERRVVLRALEVVAYWMPVWVPLLLLAQFGTRGLKPARMEEQRLAVHQEALEARRAQLLERRADLEALHEAHEDPVYQERLRRAAREKR